MEQPSLFRRRPIRRGWLVLMLMGSLLVHGALVGLGHYFWQPISQPLEIPTTDVDLAPQLGDPDVRELVVPMDAPTPPPDMPTPPPKPKTEVKKYAFTPAPANAKRGPVAVAGVVGGNPNGTKATGVPGGAKVGWFIPKPPYPAQARAAHIQGDTTVSITTDGSGRVASVEVTKSAGNAILDFNTKSYVRDNWKGPPNSTKSTTFSYVMQ